MKKPTVYITVILLVIVILAAVWWLKFRSLSSGLAPKTSPVAVQLKWLHQAQFAGHYVADKKGWYRDSGIDVTLNSFDYTHLPIDEVLKGNAQFGVTGADELLLAREQNKPVVALAVIYQENPVVAYALKSSGITKPVDFIGKKLGMESGINVETVIHAMLTSQGIDWKKSITEIPIGYDAEPLLAGQVDVATGYVTNEPILAEAAGQPVHIIEPHKYGVKLYADVIFTTEKMIEENPALVQAFVAQTIRGWEYALENVDEAVAYTLQYPDANNKALTSAHQKAQLENSIPYIMPTAGYKIGSMSFVEWKRTLGVLREFGVIKSDLNVIKAYTTEFLKDL